MHSYYCLLVSRQLCVGNQENQHEGVYVNYNVANNIVNAVALSQFIYYMPYSYTTGYKI